MGMFKNDSHAPDWAALARRHPGPLWIVQLTAPGTGNRAGNADKWTAAVNEIEAQGWRLEHTAFDSAVDLKTSGIFYATFRRTRPPENC